MLFFFFKSDRNLNKTTSILTMYEKQNVLWIITYLYWWSKCAFSIRLSLALRFWNHILIWVSVKSNASANSNLLGLDIYSFLWYSNSNLKVWSDVNVVLCRRCLGSLRLLRATVKKTILNFEKYYCKILSLFKIIRKIFLNKGSCKLSSCSIDGQMRSINYTTRGVVFILWHELMIMLTCQQVANVLYQLTLALFLMSWWPNDRSGVDDCLLTHKFHFFTIRKEQMVFQFLTPTNLIELMKADVHQNLTLNCNRKFDKIKIEQTHQIQSQNTFHLFTKFWIRDMKMKSGSL